MNLESKIASISDEIKRLNLELQVSAEQLSYLGEVADEAETRKIVSETPLADREFADAQADVERHRKYHEGLAKAIDEMKRQRDELLEKLYLKRPD